jgi:hypothetical protein
LRIVTAGDIDRVLTYPLLIDALTEAFRGEIAVPVRHHHSIPQPGADATLLLMPTWTNNSGARPDAKPALHFCWPRFPRRALSGLQDRHRLSR